MSKELHKETAITVGTGLMINYPIQLLLLFLLIDIFDMTSTFYIGTLITVIMTGIVYARVYTIRSIMSGKGTEGTEGTEPQN